MFLFQQMKGLTRGPVDVNVPLFYYGGYLPQDRPMSAIIPNIRHKEGDAALPFIHRIGNESRVLGGAKPTTIKSDNASASAIFDIVTWTNHYDRTGKLVNMLGRTNLSDAQEYAPKATTIVAPVVTSGEISFKQGTVLATKDCSIGSLPPGEMMDWKAASSAKTATVTAFFIPWEKGKLPKSDAISNKLSEMGINETISLATWWSPEREYDYCLVIAYKMTDENGKTVYHGSVSVPIADADIPRIDPNTNSLSQDFPFTIPKMVIGVCVSSKKTSDGGHDVTYLEVVPDMVVNAPGSDKTTQIVKIQRRQISDTEQVVKALSGKVYPNPMHPNSEATLAFPENNGNPIRLSIYDMTGRTVWERKFEPGTEENVEIKFVVEKNLPPGAYLFVATQEGNEKVIKQKTIIQ